MKFISLLPLLTLPLLLNCVPSSSSDLSLQSTNLSSEQFVRPTIADLRYAEKNKLSDAGCIARVVSTPTLPTNLPTGSDGTASDDLLTLFTGADQTGKPVTLKPGTILNLDHIPDDSADRNARPTDWAFRFPFSTAEANPISIVLNVPHTDPTTVQQLADFGLEFLCPPPLNVMLSPDSSIVSADFSEAKIDDLRYVDKNALSAEHCFALVTGGQLQSTSDSVVLKQSPLFTASIATQDYALGVTLPTGTRLNLQPRETSSDDAFLFRFVTASTTIVPVVLSVDYSIPVSTQQLKQFGLTLFCPSAANSNAQTDPNAGTGN